MNTNNKINVEQALQEAKLKAAIEAGQKDWNTVLSNIYVNSLSWQSKIVLFNKYIDKAIRYCSENLLTLTSSKEKLDIKYLCTRFAHECRLKGAGTNNDTCNLFDEWIKSQSLQPNEEYKEIEAVFNMSEEEIDKKLAELGYDPKEVEKNSDALIAKLKAMKLFPQKEEVDICLREGCNVPAQQNYRLCPKHLREAHSEGFDDSNK